MYLVRHGETAWSRSGQHTGITDLPLTELGEKQAAHLQGRLAGISFAKVLTSTSTRAKRTCALAGFGEVVQPDTNLVEWHYGEYEGLTSAEIHQRRPGWQIFKDGCPGGESPEQAAARADLVLQQVRSIDGNVLIFSSGHFSRMLALRWLGLASEAGRFFALDTASVSVLAYEGMKQPVIRLWNDTHHLIDK